MPVIHWTNDSFHRSGLYSQVTHYSYISSGLCYVTPHQVCNDCRQQLVLLYASLPQRMYLNPHML